MEKKNFVLYNTKTGEGSIVEATWADVKARVEGCPGMQHKSFRSVDAAEAALEAAKDTGALYQSGQPHYSERTYIVRDDEGQEVERRSINTADFSDLQGEFPGYIITRA